MPSISRSQRRVYYAITGLTALEAIVTLAWYLFIPTDPANAFLLGYSRDRLVLLSVPLTLLLLSVICAAAVRSEPRWFLHLHIALTGRFESPSRRRKWAFWCLAMASGAFVLINFTTWEAVLDRLRPLLALAIGLSLEAIVFPSALIYGFTETVRRGREWLRTGPRPMAAGIFSLAAVLFFGSVQVIRYIGVDKIGWNSTGTPILDIQLLAVILIIVLVVLAGSRLRGRLPRRADWFIFFAIWTLTATIWAGLPLKPSWYLAAPRPPNLELYPNSDALVYDLTAQNMVVGEGLRSRAFDDEQVRRPALTFFFGLLHTAAGQDYEAIGVLQSAILAVFPALVFLVGRDLGGRFAGMVAALLVLIRESNAILFSDLVTVAHAKLLMSDLPTAIGVAAFIAIALPFVRRPGSGSASRLLAAGAVVGVLILIRPETMLLLPVTAGFAFIRDRKRTTAGAGWMAVGLALIVLPWLVRNFQNTGELFIEIPGNRVTFLIDRLFRTVPEPTPDPLKVDPLPVPQEATVSIPARIAVHFLHNNLQPFLVFPATFRLGDAAIGYSLNREADRFLNSCCSGKDYIRRLPFWQAVNWEFDLPAETVIPILFHLLLFSTGLAFARRKWGAAGWMPFAFGEVYLLVNAVARTSGGRYLLPVDWIWITYYSIGLVAAVLWAVRLLVPLHGWTAINRTEPESDAGGRRLASPRLIAGAILLAGLVLPLGEQLYPQVYPEEAPQSWIDDAGLQTLAGRSEFVIVHGRALFLRYYEPGEGERGTTYRNLYSKSTHRVTLFIAGPTSSGVRLVVDHVPDFAIPSGADVIAIGCRVNSNRDPYVEAAALYFPESGVLLERDGSAEELACPLR